MPTCYTGLMLGPARLEWMARMATVGSANKSVWTNLILLSTRDWLDLQQTHSKAFQRLERT